MHVFFFFYLFDEREHIATIALAKDHAGAQDDDARDLACEALQIIFAGKLGHRIWGLGG